MSEMVETKVTPENDIQELWELNGRVAATLAYLRKEPYTINREIVIDMLTGESHGSDL